jgi:hypothetical protein
MRSTAPAVSSTGKPRTAEELMACTSTTSPSRARSWSTSWIRLFVKAMS